MATPIPRKRAERSCETCRKRKTRCVIDGDAAGVCVLCRFHQQECKFLDNSSPRKRKSASISSEHGQTRPPSKRRKRPVESDLESNKQWRLIRTRQGVSVEEYDQMEDPSLLKRTLGLLNKYHCRYFSVSGSFEPAMMAARSTSMYREIEVATGGTLRWVGPTDAFLLIPDLGTPGYLEERQEVETVESLVSPHGRTLLDIYFRVVYPSFPVLYRDVYMEKYIRSPLEFSPSSLAAVYLLAIRFWSHEVTLQDKEKPCVEKLEALGRKCLHDAINYRPKLSTIQAGLQLLQYSTTNAKELTAQLINVAYGVGLHLDASDWDIPPWEKSLRKRLSWALYSQDKWNSLANNQPPLINSSHWGVPTITEEDFPEQHEYEQEGSSEVEKGRALFCQFVALSEIVSDILDDILSIRAIKEIEHAGERGLELLLRKAKPLQIRLKEWFTNLPPALSMEVTNVMKLSSVGYLRLAYITAEIALHRQILLALPGSTDTALIKLCRSVADERFIFAIDLLKSLKPNHLSSFWYSTAPQNLALTGTFGCYLYMTETDPERRLLCKARLREYRWLLTMCSDNGPNSYFKQALSQLDIYFKYLLDSKDENGDSGPSISYSPLQFFGDTSHDFLDISPDGTSYHHD
ncbi:hypothetical protein A1O1_00269 [Capronia coronata CBS 617.96]|uniref:Zn(2)-C6 fungal-type domain-containing protein n=1 Tax=Capronia coronata CBS 617.96 TaxID=1182541 RepID=W9YZM7_9EURO|nr:uncharacterized protein A1O1_00269 [Capronia coronata CBS 617.96]EXJ95150.1 hypothetical protein A1O1_00269 [Capronia coronata CBS 617.96]